MKLLLPFVAIIVLVSSHTYFHEDFSNPNWEERWVVSNWKKSSGEAGKWELVGGLKTTEDARFYSVSAEFKEFSNKGTTLVIQFSVRHTQNIDCGGGYIKLLPAGLDQSNFQGGADESKYNIMFGPDICGSTNKVHLIFHNKGKNHLLKKIVSAEKDSFTHVYTAVIEPDNTYKILIDGEEKEKGSIPEDWDILPPKQIKDPQQSKPADWVDEKFIDDPEDKKPEGWDDIPAEIVDSEATKPDDWDDELDGEWEAPKIANPEFKGPWSPRKIENPLYKGVWEHPLIDNPDYKEDPNLYAYDSFKYIGLDLWQVKSGSVFDDFLLTDDFDLAKAEIDEIVKRRDAEKEEESKKVEHEHDHDHEHDHEHEHDHDHNEPPEEEVDEKVDL